MTILCCCSQQTNGLDWMSITGLIVAIIAIVITLYAIYAGKRVEISVDKFDKLCREPLEERLKVLDELFDKHRTELIHKHLVLISDITSDLGLLFVALNSIYPKLDVNSLQDRTHVFSDTAFANNTHRLFFIQSSYLQMKIDLFDQVYKYALYKEVKFLSLKLHFWR